MTTTTTTPKRKYAKKIKKDDDIRKLTEKEAAKVKKQEEAIRLRRQNLIASGSLVSFDEVSAVLTRHYQTMGQGINEALDTVFVKYNLPQQYQQEIWNAIVTKLKVALQQTIEGIKSGQRGVARKI